MTKFIFTILFSVGIGICYAQIEEVSGILISKETAAPIEGAFIIIETSENSIKSIADGSFLLKGSLPLGEQILAISKEGFSTVRLPIVIETAETLNLGKISLNIDFKGTQQLFATIDLSDSQLENDNDDAQEQTLLQATRDPFLTSVAFNWSATFFKVRGQGSEQSKILLNGVEMNKMYNNRPSWSNWSGLNDILRSQEITTYLKPNDKNFGGLLGVTNLNINAGAFAKGKKVSFSSTNRSYQGRVMTTYHSGMQSNGWAYSFSASARSANEGYVEGTTLKAYSIFASIEKEINDRHNLSFSVIYTPVIRGKSSPNTKEVTSIKGRKYNAYWGNQDGKIRNSRIKRIQEPVFMLNHFWKFNDQVTVQNNMLFQKGIVGNSRLDYTGKTVVENSGQTFFEGGGKNPDPTYYQTLPSYFLRNSGNENYQAAFLADRSFRANGQLNWNSLYKANSDHTKNASYALYEDRNDDTFFALNTILNYKISEKFTAQGKLTYRKLKSENFAEILDLLGGKNYLDIDAFSQGDQAQSDLQNPNRLVQKGDAFKYNYQFNTSNINGFAQLNYNLNKWNAFISIFAERQQYQRLGKYQNGHFPNNSLGKSKKLSFIGSGFKIGSTYQISYKLYGSVSFLAISKPPVLQHAFENPRQNNATVFGLQNEQLTAGDIALNYQHGSFKSRLSGYLIKRHDATNRSFFFTDNLAGLGRVENAGFFQEIMTGIDTQNTGMEFGSEITLTSTLTLNISAAYGVHKYTNNPNLYITSDNISERVEVGKTFLKNYRLPTGPQQAYGVGFGYRDPTYWWLSTQLNYFNDSYSNISPFTRSNNFTTDIDGQPFSNFNETRAQQLLQQEQFSSYFLWNAIGGKSWRIKGTYLGITLGVQNILNQLFKTGGFEQSRNSNFKTLSEDRNRENPLFGSKYWYGSGTTFYANLYWRF